MATRILHDALLSSPSLATCSPRAQDAFPRFLLLADDFGCFDAHPRILLGRGWPLRPDVTEADLAGWLKEYEAAGMLQVWSEGGRTYGFLTGWTGSKGQRKREEYSPTNPKGSRRKTPAPPITRTVEQAQATIRAALVPPKPAEPLPAREPTGKTQAPAREPTGQSDFPRLQSQSQSQSHVEASPAGARARGASPGQADLIAADVKTPLDVVADAYERVNGVRPRWGIRQENDLRPLGDVSDEELGRRAERAFRNTGYPKVATPHELVKHWDHFAADRQAAGGGGPKDLRKGRVGAEDVNPEAFREVGRVKDF
jgi:hypothetical protein